MIHYKKHFRKILLNGTAEVYPRRFFFKSDKSKNLSVEETVDKKLSDKMKASEVLEEVFL